MIYMSTDTTVVIRGNAGLMYKQWTKNDIKESKKRLYHLYINAPADYRFICGHDIQSEEDEDSLDYYMIGAWMVQHRKYAEWSGEKSFDLADILEFMRIYQMRIPRYIKHTGFYRKKKRKLQNTLLRIK